LLGAGAIANIETGARALVETWYFEDDVDPYTIVRPYDLLVFRVKKLASNHVGVMLDRDLFATSTQENGVCKEHLSRWRSYLLQIARLREGLLRS
jgi:hypothetical protein